MMASNEPTRTEPPASRDTGLGMVATIFGTLLILALLAVTAIAVYSLWPG